MIFAAGIGLGFGIGFVLGLLYWHSYSKSVEVDARSFSDRDDAMLERIFLTGAKAQAELGFLVKKVPAEKEDAGALEAPRHPTPKLRRDHNPSSLGEEHPAGGLPPRPQDFTPVETPRAFTERLKTTPRT